MNRLPVLFGLIALLLALLVGAGATQEKKDKDDPKKAKGMLPPGFKDLGLSADQKGKIYSIQSDYKMKISDLQKKIKDLQAEESTAVFKVLTDEQRDKYLKAKGVDVKGKDKDKDKNKDSK
jgi:hypothetical protein